MLHKTLSFDINSFLLSFSDYLEHSWNRLEYLNSSVLNNQKSLTENIDAKKRWFNAAYDGACVKIQNYQNDPKYFLNFGSPNSQNLYVMYTQMIGTTEFVSQLWLLCKLITRSGLFIELWVWVTYQINIM